MTRDDVIRMATEAGILEPGYTHGRTVVFELQKFAALVAAAEREACALECDRTYHQHIGPEHGEVRYGIAACAAAIRARSNA